MATQTDKAASSMGKSATASSGFGKALGGVASIASGFVIGQGLMAAPGILMNLGQAGASLELQMKKNSTVFGDQLGVVQQWAAENARAMGLTRNEATSLSAGLADLLIPMGMSREAAAQMST